MTFTPLDDAAVEGDEALDIKLGLVSSVPNSTMEYEGPDGTVSLAEKLYPVTIKDDDTAPTVTDLQVISEPQAETDTYGIAEVIEIELTLSDPVVVQGIPVLAFDLGGARTEAGYDRGSGTTKLVFAYRVMTGDMDSNGISLLDSTATVNPLVFGSGEAIVSGLNNTVNISTVFGGGGRQDDHKVDAVAPALVSAAGAVHGAEVVLTFDEALDETAGARPASGDFTVTVSGSADDGTIGVSGVAVSGDTVTLTLAGAIPGGGAVRATVDYVPGARPLRDLTGNPAARIDAHEFTPAPDETAPVLVSAVVDGELLTLTYDERLKETQPTSTGDSVYLLSYAGDGAPSGEVRGSNIRAGEGPDGTQVTMTLSLPAAPGYRVTVTYFATTATPASRVQDPSGNAAAALLARAAENITVPVEASMTLTANGRAVTEVTEGRSGEATVTVTVNIDGDPFDEPKEITLSGEGTAAETGDWTIAEKDMTLAADGRRVVFTATIVDDERDEAAETVEFVARLGGSAIARAELAIADDDPSPAPAAPLVRSVSATSLAAAWSAPEDAVAPVTGYDVQYRRSEGDPPWRDGPQMIAETRVTIDGLSVKVEYEVRVRARNAGGGPGRWSEQGRGTPLDAYEGQPRLGDEQVLEDGNVKGRLEIFHEGRWGTVCDDRFDGHGSNRDNKAAEASCKLMGYEGGHYVSGFGQSVPHNVVFVDRGQLNPGVTRDVLPIWLDDLRCSSADATSLYEDCNHAGWGLHNCTHEEDAGVRCTGELEASSAMAAPAVEDVPEVSDPAGDGGYAANERIEARVTFTDPVTVNTAGGTPTLGLAIGGVRREAGYESGSDTAVLVFSYTATAADAGAEAARAIANGLVLHGATVRIEDGSIDAELTFGTAPGIARLAAGGDANGDGQWSPGESVELTVVFDEPVVVDSSDGTPSIGFLLGGSAERTATWAGGSGTASLTFAYEVQAADGAASSLLVAENALAPNGATIRSTAGLDAVLTRTSAAFALARGLALPAVSVADAEASERADATLSFAVTLDEASETPVTVAYATSDGTATGGSDYTADSGTLTFAPGETAKTVEVAVLGDTEEEGAETLTLTLSEPSGAILGDAEATGTIDGAESGATGMTARFVSMPADHDGSAAFAFELVFGEENDEDGERLSQSWSVSGRDLLTGSSLALTGGNAETGFSAVWGRGTVSSFDGRDGDLTVGGEVVSALLGADWTRERLTAGLTMAHSRGEGDYRSPGGGGTVSSTLTGLYPYGRYEATDRISVWGVVGYGAGTLALTPEGTSRIDTDMDLAMAAAGLRGVLVRPDADGGLELSVKTDAMAVRTTSEPLTLSGSGGNLAAAEADVTRLMLGFEGVYLMNLAAGASLRPMFELGLRHDGGDAETGFGADIGAGLAWSDPARGIAAEVRGRGLLSHEADGLRERGLSGSLSFDPQPAGRGLRLQLTQTVGASASGGADALLGRETLAGLSANDDGNELRSRRLEAVLGYGMDAIEERFIATPEVGVALSQDAREYRLGWRLGLARSAPVSVELSLDGTRREAANDDRAPEHAVGLRLNARW